MATTKERIILLLNNKGVTISNFFSSIGVSYSNFKGKQLESSPSADLVAKIKSNFPDVNTDWLLTGEGEMFVKKDLNFDFAEIFFEKVAEVLNKHERKHDDIIGQNGEIIKQNSEVMKQNSMILDQNAAVIKQNSDLMLQHANAMSIIQKLSEKLK